MTTATGSVSGHVYRFDGHKSSTWRAKYRLPDGRQIQKKIGPAWTGRGRTPNGYFTKRTAEAWLREVLDQAREGTLPGLVRTEVTVERAAEEYLRYIRIERERKASTVRDYRSVIDTHILPTFGSTPIEDVTTEAIELWLANLGAGGRPLSNRQRAKTLTVLHGLMERARRMWKLPRNPVKDVEKPRTAPVAGIDVFSPEEVHALCRAAASEQDAAIYLTAAFTGLRRSELIALRWRDVDFRGYHVRVSAAYVVGVLSSPKSGKIRSVPMAPAVAEALEALGRRPDFVGDDDLVFIGDAGGHLDGSALLRRYKSALKRAGLRPLRFHDLRHTFGSRMIAEVDIVRLQEWMGHADIATTRKYLHFSPRPDDARLVAKAFATS